MHRDEIERTLDAMGSLPVDPADEATLARIEARWRFGDHATPVAPVTLMGSPRRRMALAGGGLLAVAAGITAALALSLGSSPNQVVVAEAEDIVILLPDGQFVDPQPGEALPEGSFVQAGPYAAGRIGGAEVHPDDLFVVAGGRLQPADIQQLTSARPASSLVSTVAPEPTPPATRHVDQVTTSASPTTVPATTTLAPTSTTAAPTTVATSTTAATGASTAPTGPASLRVRARVVGGTTGGTTGGTVGGTVSVSWKASGGDAFRRYVVYRVTRWDGSSRPSTGRLGAVSDPSTTTFVDLSPERDTTYVVVVVGPDQQVLAIGGVHTPYTSDAVTPTTVATEAVPITIEPQT